MKHESSDVPPHIDFTDPAEARSWAEQAGTKRPAREEFFQVFANELASLGEESISVLELGSGPGFLAERILHAMPHAQYTALDLSPAMHALAHERLGRFSGGVHFVEANFIAPDWNVGLPVFDAVVTMQSVHELRNKSRVPALYAQVRTVLRTAGLFLVCDHCLGEGGRSDPAVYLTVEEQGKALRDAGFSETKLLLQKDGLALWRARDVSVRTR